MIGRVAALGPSRGAVSGLIVCIPPCESDFKRYDIMPVDLVLLDQVQRGVDGGLPALHGIVKLRVALENLVLSDRAKEPIGIARSCQRVRTQRSLQ